MINYTYTNSPGAIAIADSFWVLWTAGFVPTATQSNYKIVVRATDKTGKVQTAEIRPPYPDGATGYHMINI